MPPQTHAGGGHLSNNRRRCGGQARTSADFLLNICSRSPFLHGITRRWASRTARPRRAVPIVWVCSRCPGASPRSGVRTRHALLRTVAAPSLWASAANWARNGGMLDQEVGAHSCPCGRVLFHSARVLQLDQIKALSAVSSAGSPPLQLDALVSQCFISQSGTQTSFAGVPLTESDCWFYRTLFEQQPHHVKKTQKRLKFMHPIGWKVHFWHVSDLKRKHFRWKASF